MIVLCFLFLFGLRFYYFYEKMKLIFRYSDRGNGFPRRGSGLPVKGGGFLGGGKAYVVHWRRSGRFWNGLRSYVFLSKNGCFVWMVNKKPYICRGKRFHDEESGSTRCGKYRM